MREVARARAEAGSRLVKLGAAAPEAAAAEVVAALDATTVANTAAREGAALFRACEAARLLAWLEGEPGGAAWAAAAVDDATRRLEAKAKKAAWQARQWAVRPRKRRAGGGGGYDEEEETQIQINGDDDDDDDDEESDDGSGD